MRASKFPAFLFICGIALCSAPLQAAVVPSANSALYYRGGTRYLWFTRVVRYWRVPVVHPAARVDPRIDPRLMRAATIAQQHATARSQARCWHYVKDALVAAGAINSYPKTAYAAEAETNWFTPTGSNGYRSAIPMRLRSARSLFTEIEAGGTWSFEPGMDLSAIIARRMPASIR